MTAFTQRGHSRTGIECLIHYGASMENDAGEITQLLRQWREGSGEAENELFHLVMPDLRRLAQYFLKGERRDHSLQPSDLVNQIYVRLVAARDRDWQNRRHFFAIAARAMRRYLIDHARRARPPMLPAAEVADMPAASGSRVELALAIGQLLDEMNHSVPELCTIVELKFFLGLTDSEAADALGLKLRSLQRKWHQARRWLFERLDHD